MKAHHKTLLLLTVLVMPYGRLPAQSPAIHLEELIIPDAPPLATIGGFYEDSYGFIWMGCLSGLYLFDGYSLTTFTRNTNDSLSISDNKVTKLLEDKQGNLWVGTQVGLNYFDRKKRTFKRYIDKNGIGGIHIHDITQDKAGKTWVGADDGLYRFDETNLKFEKYFPASQSNKETYKAFELMPTETGIYFFSKPGFLYLDFKTKEVVTIPTIPSIAAFHNDIITAIRYSNGRIWIGTSVGLYYYMPLSGNPVLEHPAFQNEYVNFIAENNDHTELWIATEKGLSVLNPRTNECKKNIPIVTPGRKPDGEEFFTGLFASSDMLWMSTNSRKIYKLNTQWQRFHHCPVNLVEELSGIPGLFELYEYSPGVLLVPKKSGAALLNIHTQKAIPFPWRPNYNLSGWKKGVICFSEEKGGMLWIGTGGGLFLFDKNKNRFINIEQQWKALSKLNGMAIRRIHRDRKNRLWIVTWGYSLFRFNFDTGILKQYNSTNADIENTRSILESRSGEIWVGTRGGLLRYIESPDSFQVYKNIPGDPESMSDNTAFCIYEDADGHIWVGTYGGGLNQLNLKTEKFKHYSTADGLKNNNVFSILPDQNDNLWLMGYDGISRFNRATETFQTFTYDQGLLNKEYDAFLYGRSRYSNLLFFCGKTGIDYFDPDHVQLSSFDPKVWITDFKLFNETVPIGQGNTLSDTFTLAQDISFTREIRLRYDQNVITLGFAALDYASSKTIQYAYQLVGFDADWQYAGARRNATYTNLNPGTYTFKVRATNSDGVWGTQTATLAITVLTPWWRSWWFFSLIFLFLAGLVFAFYQFRIRQIKERESIRANLSQRIAEVKMEALRSQMNPHFIFNCLSSLKAYVEKKDTENASIHISKFAKLLRQVLDQSRSGTITLEAELDTLQRYVELEKMRYKEKINFRMEIQPDLPVEDITIPPLLIQPYLENAIWHGLKHKTSGQGLLLLKVDAHEGECRIIVEDNGIGRAASLELKKKSNVAHQSHGLNVAAERIALFNQKYGNDAKITLTDLFDDAGKASGTRATFTFKTSQL